jgi:hypothetical protein
MRRMTEPFDEAMKRIRELPNEERIIFCSSLNFNQPV